MARILALLAVLAAAPALAQSDAFPFGDPALGRRIAEAKCTGCHAARWGGDGSGVYRRADRKVKSTQSLLAWVQRCNAGNRLELNAEEEESIAAWLNATYYRLK
jgi:mono/diheme cytochrome c family protein